MTLLAYFSPGHWAALVALLVVAIVGAFARRPPPVKVQPRRRVSRSDPPRTVERMEARLRRALAREDKPLALRTIKRMLAAGCSQEHIQGVIRGRDRDQ